MHKLCAQWCQFSSWLRIKTQPTNRQTRNAAIFFVSYAWIPRDMLSWDILDDVVVDDDYGGGGADTAGGHKLCDHVSLSQPIKCTVINVSYPPNSTAVGVIQLGLCCQC